MCHLQRHVGGAGSATLGAAVSAGSTAVAGKHPTLPAMQRAGEVPWAVRTIRQYHEQAVRNRVKIVHMCGFDSIPSDLGAYLVAMTIKKKYNRCAAALLRCLHAGRSGGVLDPLVGGVSRWFAGAPAVSGLWHQRQQTWPAIMSTTWDRCTELTCQSVEGRQSMIRGCHAVQEDRRGARAAGQGGGRGERGDHRVAHGRHVRREPRGHPPVQRPLLHEPARRAQAGARQAPFPDCAQGLVLLCHPLAASSRQTCAAEGLQSGACSELVIARRLHAEHGEVRSALLVRPAGAPMARTSGAQSTTPLQRSGPCPSSCSPSTRASCAAAMRCSATSTVRPPWVTDRALHPVISPLPCLAADTCACSHMQTAACCLLQRHISYMPSGSSCIHPVLIASAGLFWPHSRHTERDTVVVRPVAGENFSYKEAMELPNAFAAYLGSGVLALVYLVLSARFLRPLVMRVLPAPGEGPSRKQQVEGFWCVGAQRSLSLFRPSPLTCT